jgi:hypothetical protein
MTARDMDLVAFTRADAPADVLVVAFRTGTSDADRAEWVTENLGPALHLARLGAAETVNMIHKYPAEVEHLMSDLGEGYDVAVRRVRYHARTEMN